MAILKIRDVDGKVYEIPALRGEKGDKGDAPVKGVDYYTEADKTELVAAVIAALPNGDKEDY